MLIPHKQRDISRYSLLFVFVLLWGCGGSERVPLRGGTEHLLLLHDRIMRYEEQNGPETRTITIRMSYMGGRAARAFELISKDAGFGRCRLISSGKQVFFETNKPATVFQDVPEFRELWVDEDVSVGGSWENSDTGTETVVAPSETVTVPAGTYENCYKTVTTGTQALLDSLKAWNDRAEISDQDFKTQMRAAQTPVVRWFASGVGLVKVQFGGPEHVRELEAVVKPGTGRTTIETPEEE
jgi:hypothetical protein